MRGIPATPVSKIASGFSNDPKKFQRPVTKREGGAVLIDISDIPQPSNMKKRRGPTTPKLDPETGEPKKRGRKPKKSGDLLSPGADGKPQKSATGEGGGGMSVEGSFSFI
jgi:hypothetical protein